MQLNHLNLCVDDLDRARALFETSFDFEFIEQKGEAVAILSDRHGFTLVLSNPRAFGGEMRSYPEGFHVGFLVESREQVDDTYQRLAAAEVHLAQEPRKMRGSYGFYFTALNNILFEVSGPPQE